MKKILLLLTLLPLMANAQTLIDGFYYDLDTSDNTAAITSIGYNCYSGDIVIPSIVKYEGVTYIVTRINGGFRYCPNLTSVKIPSSVTKIGKGLFYGSENLTTIIVESGNTRYDSRNNCNAIIETKTNTLIEGCKTTVIPNSVTCIGEGAFSFCSRLTSIEIPNSVTTIGNWAFSECINLTSVTIPSSVTSIGEGTFYECMGLKSVIIPNSVTSIGDEAFLDCINLTSLTIPNSVTSIGNRAFSACSGLESVEMPNSVTSIGDGAFASCSGLTSVTIPNSVTSIGGGAFARCSVLASVEIPNSVTSIEDGTFGNCSELKSVTIPNSVTSIGSDVFYSCINLRDIYCYAENVPTTNSNAFVATPMSYATLHVPEASVEAYKATAPWNGFGSIVALDIEPVPIYNTCIDGIYYIIDTSAKTATVTSGYSGYTGCVNIPATVTDNDIIYSVTEIGDDAFLQCSGMTSVTIPNSVTVIGNSAFDFCSGLTSIEIPNSVTTIGDGAFASCSGLTSVTIPNGVTSIGTVAFYNCKGLTSVEIPNSVTSIGFMAFSDCSVLNDVYCYAENVPTTNSNAFLNSPISSATLHVPAASVEAYKATAPWNGFGSIVALDIEPVPTYNTCIDGIYYIIDTSAKTATVTSGYSGYTGCVNIPATVTDNDIIYSVTEIGDDAFLQCSGMTSVTIPNSVTVIGNSAFDFCSGLTSIEIPNSVTTIGDGAFASCSGLTSVTIPNGVTSIGTVAFYNCKGLTSVEIPNSVTSIGFMAFSDCSVLNDVYCYAENVPTTNSNAFLNSPISSATLHVPAASVEAYKATAPWNGFGSIVAAGDEPVGKKCATPTISLVNGKLEFTCETEDVEFVAKVTCPDSGEYEGSSIPLTTTYIVTVYAKKDGYEDSDVAMKEIIVGGAAGIKGDVNEDGTVNGTDIQEVINIIVNAE